MSKQLRNIPQCVYGNPCVQLCINPQCSKPGFICQNGSIHKQQCALFHENCHKMKWVEVQTILYENPHTKIPELSQLQDEMQLFFTQALRKIKQQHLNFKIWARTYGYSEQLMNFIHLVNQGNYNKVSGVYMNKILSQIFMKEKKEIKETFNLTTIHETKKQINDLFQSIKEIYKTPSKIRRNSITTPIISIQSILDSKITDQVDYLISLFPKVIPKRFNLLYRASDCNFLVEEFHKRCDNIPNTLLIVKTEYGKVIGGYTPLPWDSSNKHWASDKSLTSFIFSLQMRQKFQLNLAQFAIACHPDKGPVFGCCDICIVDKSDIQKSNAQFPISYNNFKHDRSPETSLAFTGNSKGKFCIQQWQIFHVQFQHQ